MLDTDIADQVDQLSIVLDEEVMVITDIGVEIGTAAVDSDYTQKSSPGELVKHVVDRGQGDMDAGRLRFSMQILRRKMAIAFGEKNAAQLDALTRRTKAGVAQFQRDPISYSRSSDCPTEFHRWYSTSN